MKGVTNGGSVIRKLRRCEVFLHIARREISSLPIDSSQCHSDDRPRPETPKQRNEQCGCEEMIRSHARHAGEARWGNQAEASNVLRILAGKMIDERSAQ